MIDEITGSLTKTLDYLRRLVADVPDELMTAQPFGAANHPAWVIGHLTYSFQLIGGEMGLPPWLPPNWEHQFGTGSLPTDSPDTYPTKPELLHLLADGAWRVCQRLSELGIHALYVPLPDARYRHVFPTLGYAVLHVLTSHAAVHVGQVSVWRRVAGLTPLTEVFH
jgi:hypothetical protein